jgi:hypothetical protein
VVLTNGNVGIGTANPTNALAVNGTIMAREIIVTTSNWADFVFAPGYRLMPLEELDAYLRLQRHLPGVPAADTVAREGISVGPAQVRLLQKIEELTLYLLQLKNENAALKSRIEALERSHDGGDESPEGRP